MSLPLIKDCGDIWKRLFDHTPFLSGEIGFFMREFEDSICGPEFDRLIETAELVADIGENKIPEALTSSSNLNQLNTLLDIALQTSDIILEEEDNFDVDEALKLKRASRKSDWENFSKDFKEQCDSINKTFTEKEKDLLKFYEDLENKLYI